jgi:hypothetical protein
LNAKNDAKNEDPGLKKKRNTIGTYISRCQQRILEIGQKGTSVEQKIYAHLKEVLAQLTEELEKKVKVLQSDKYELQRQMEEIEFSESFFAQQATQLSGIDFINLWINHKIHKKNLMRIPTIVTEVQVCLILLIFCISPRLDWKADCKSLVTLTLEILQWIRFQLISPRIFSRQSKGKKEPTNFVVPFSRSTKPPSTILVLVPTFLPTQLSIPAAMFQLQCDWVLRI